METPQEMYERLLKKCGDDPEKLAFKLLKLNIQAKEEIANLQDDVKEASSQGLTKDHVAIPKADLAALEEYRKLGDIATVKASVEELGRYRALGDVKAVEASVKELPTLKDAIARRDHEAVLEAVSKDPEGGQRYNPAVLKRLVPDPHVRFVRAKHVVKERTTGKDIEVDGWNVVDTGPDGKTRTRTLHEWEDDPEVKPILPALRAGVDERSRPAAEQVVRGGNGYRGDSGHGPILKLTDEDDDVRRHIKVDSYAAM